MASLYYEKDGDLAELSGRRIAVVGYGIGVGVAGIFTLATRKAESELSVFFPWQLAAASFGCTLLCIGLGSVVSIRRVVKVSPSMVFGS